jgi:Family of unknown function (DUF6455)
MPTKPPEIRWPFLDNVIVPVADWWRREAAARENLGSLDAIGPVEIARMAQDIGISTSDLRALARHCSDAADLLQRRLESLGLDASELGSSATAQLRDMERLCTLCESKGRCARDLDADPSDPIWRQYCPNHETLVALQEGSCVNRDQTGFDS